MRSYFDILETGKKLELDAEALQSKYYKLSRKNHPDLFLSKGEAEYKKALDESSLINKAYNTLKDPITRANYILEIDAPQIANEKSNIVHNDLLEDVMEMQEKIGDYHEASGDSKEALKKELELIRTGLSQKMESLKAEMNKIFNEYDNSNEASKKDSILKKLKSELHKRNYMNTLIRTIDHEIFGAEVIRH